MTADRVLVVVLREMTAYGSGWRANWSDFDGRWLESQLRFLDKWAHVALNSSYDGLDYRGGTQFSEARWEES